jgi:hypothetical protein
MATKYAVVLPYVHEPYFRACMKTVKFPKENLLVIDNTVNNVGIMRSHNMGIDFMRQRDADWLIILSAAVRFGKPGGLDFIDQLAAHDDHYVIHAASANVKGGKQHDGTKSGGGVNKVFGWHLTAFKREVFDNIGRWDENFSPYSLDDVDLSLRIQKFYRGAPGWDTYPIDVIDTTMGHSINLGGVKAPYEPREAYFKRKWNRGGGDWEDMGSEYPFGDPTKPLSYWPQPDDPLSIHNNEYKVS